jgi:hypothetical protein
MLKALILVATLAAPISPAPAPQPSCEALVEDMLTHYTTHNVVIDKTVTTYGKPGEGNVFYYLRLGKEFALLAMVAEGQPKFSIPDKGVSPLLRRKCKNKNGKAYQIFVDLIVPHYLKEKGEFR